jgi:hypothetical protein
MNTAAAWMSCCLNVVLRCLDAVLSKLAHLRGGVRHAAQMPSNSLEDLAELQRAGLIDPIAKVKAEAVAMMATEVARQKKALQSKVALAAKEAEQSRAAETLKEEQFMEQERVQLQFKAKQVRPFPVPAAAHPVRACRFKCWNTDCTLHCLKSALKAEIDRRRQEAMQWR